MAYRKVEHTEINLTTLNPEWVEIGFSQLKKGEIFRLTDIDDNNQVDSAGFEDGTRVHVATSNPYLREGTLTIDADDIDGDILEPCLHANDAEQSRLQDEDGACNDGVQ